MDSSDRISLDDLSDVRKAVSVMRLRSILAAGAGGSPGEHLLSPHALLDGAQPAEMPVIDPARVLRAALVEFGRDV